MFSGIRLAWRFFSVVVLIITIMAVSVYLYSVPLVQDKVYEIERNSARLALDNVYKLADKAYANLEGFKAQALDANKESLRAVVTLTASHIESSLALAEANQIPAANAWQQVFASLRHFTYGNDGYIWVVDHQARMLSHPDTRYNGKTLASFQVPAVGVIAPMIAAAIRSGEGFYQYPWQRVAGQQPTAKLSYVKDYPQWQLVIGSGLYLDDLEAAVAQRKQQAIEEIRKALSIIRIADTGYLFIFDQQGQIIAHPNTNIDQTNAIDLIDPASGRRIVEELIEVADTGTELSYRWDKPDDPGVYRYEKISIVRRMASFDWYICATVYVAELQHSSMILSQRIITITAIAILLALLLALYFINLISQPIQTLARTAERVRTGDLSATSGIDRHDEIGTLARTFDSMVYRLHSNIQTLDQSVRERTHALAALEERQRLILDALPAQIAYLDRQLRYVFVNQGYAEQFDSSKAALLGQHMSQIAPPDLLAAIAEPLQQCLNGHPTTYEYSFNHQGRTRVTRRQLIPDYAGDQAAAAEVQGVLVLSLDISHEKESERRLAEAQRMQATGQLAGGLAHDFNNLLTIILGNLSAMQASHPGVNPTTSSPDTDAPLQHHLAPAIRATHRAIDITKRLLAFARRQHLSPSLTDVRPLLKETALLLRGSLPDQLELTVVCHTPLALCIDAAQLENALINLALNARDAILQQRPTGPGRIGFYAHQQTLPQGLQQTDSHYDDDVPAGTYINIGVYDDGPGFPAEVQQRAFEPFFTTRASNNSGLGLSMVFGFVKQSGGFIRIRPATTDPEWADGEGRSQSKDPEKSADGAAISLLLPLNSLSLSAPTPPETTASAATEPAPHPESDTDNTDNNHWQLALLVDDDAAIRRLVRPWLLALGYVVVEASDANEASDLIDSLATLDLLITDLSMPGNRDGWQLAQQARQQHPHLPYLLISGTPSHPEQPTDHGVLLAKPFTRDAIHQAITHAVTQSTNGPSAAGKLTPPIQPDHHQTEQ